MGVPEGGEGDPRRVVGEPGGRGMTLRIGDWRTVDPDLFNLLDFCDLDR